MATGLRFIRLLRYARNAGTNCSYRYRRRLRSPLTGGVNGHQDKILELGRDHSSLAVGVTEGVIGTLESLGKGGRQTRRYRHWIGLRKDCRAGVTLLLRRMPVLAKSFAITVDLRLFGPSLQETDDVG